MIFHRGEAVVSEQITILNGLYEESIRFTDVSTRLIDSTGKNLTLFGEASTSVTIIGQALRAIDSLLSAFRAAPGIGKIIQKVLDQVVSVVRRALPPFQRALSRLSRTGSVLNATAIPLAKGVVDINLIPLFSRVSPWVDALLFKLADLKQQQRLIEALLPRPALANLWRRVRELERLRDRTNRALSSLKATNDLLDDRRAFLDRIYGVLSAKKVVLDTVKAYLDEIASAISWALSKVGNAIPGVVKNFITALLDFLDTAIDWVLEQLKALLEWIGIDISGALAWIQSAKAKLGQKLADFLSLLGELENLVAPLEELLAYLQSEVLARIAEAARALEKVEERSRELLALLNGLGAWKLLLEALFPEWIRWLKGALERVDAQGPRAAAAVRRELERNTSESWKLAAIPAGDFVLLGDWMRLVNQTRRLLANRAVLKSADRRRKAIQALEVDRQRLESDWKARYGKAVARLPRGYFERLRTDRAPEVPEQPSRKPQPASAARFAGEARALRALLPRQRAARQTPRIRSLKRLEGRLDRLLATAPPRRASPGA
jgi:hypothetical protein